MIASFSLLYGINEVPNYGWQSPLVISLLTLGMVALLFFILTELAVKEPMMELVMMPIITAGVNTIPKAFVGQATGITDTLRQLAMSFGTAILTTYLVTRSTVRDIHMSWQVTGTSLPGQFLHHLGDVTGGGASLGARICGRYG